MKIVILSMEQRFLVAFNYVSTTYCRNMKLWHIDLFHIFSEYYKFTL